MQLSWAPVGCPLLSAAAHRAVSFPCGDDGIPRPATGRGQGTGDGLCHYSRAAGVRVVLLTSWRAVLVSGVRTGPGNNRTALAGCRAAPLRPGDDSPLQAE